MRENARACDSKPARASKGSSTGRPTPSDSSGCSSRRWTFARISGVDLTNNFAECQLRHAVMLRKISCGSQSNDGMEWMSRLLSVVMTTRSQGRNPHEFLLASARAARAEAPPPSLLPANPARELATHAAA